MRSCTLQNFPFDNLAAIWTSSSGSEYFVFFLDPLSEPFILLHVPYKLFCRIFVATWWGNEHIQHLINFPLIGLNWWTPSVSVFFRHKNYLSLRAWSKTCVTALFGLSSVRLKNYFPRAPFSVPVSFFYQFGPNLFQSWVAYFVVGC